MDYPVLIGHIVDVKVNV